MRLWGLSDGTSGASLAILALVVWPIQACWRSPQQGKSQTDGRELLSEPFTREESESEGLIVLRNVRLERAESEDTGAIIYLRGVERGLGGFIVRAFLGADRVRDESLTADHADFLGEIFIYASMSPEVPEEQRQPLPPGTPPPLPLEPYDTFIDITRAESRFGDEPSVDLTLTLATLDDKPVPAHFFRFADVSIRCHCIPENP